MSVSYFVRYDIDTAERAQAREDFKRFPPFTGTVTHQAMHTQEQWRKKA